MNQRKQDLVMLDVQHNNKDQNAAPRFQAWLPEWVEVPFAVEKGRSK